MFNRIYAFCWLLLQFLASAYSALRSVVLRLRAAALRSYDVCRGEETITRRDVTLLEHCRQRFSKLPRHILVIISPDSTEVNGEVLSRIASYALLMQVNCVSFYDARPCPTKKVPMQKIRTPKGVHCKEVDHKRVVWTSYSGANGRLNGFKKADYQGNGASNGQLQHKSVDKTIELNEITSADGRPLLAQVCRELFEQRHSSQVQALLKDRTSLTKYIDSASAQHLGSSTDPDLCIIFGKYMSTFGVLPWQTRFTEFHLHDDARCFNADAFATVLQKYSRCEQRWGK